MSGPVTAGTTSHVQQGLGVSGMAFAGGHVAALWGYRRLFLAISNLLAAAAEQSRAEWSKRSTPADLTVPNRLVQSTTVEAISSQGLTDALLANYRDLAGRGAGTENGPSCDQFHVEGLDRMAEAVHNSGTSVLGGHIPLAKGTRSDASSAELPPLCRYQTRWTGCPQTNRSTPVAA